MPGARRKALPFFLILRVTYARDDHYPIYSVACIVWPHVATHISSYLALFIALQCCTLKNLLFRVLHCKPSWGCTSIATLFTIFRTFLLSDSLGGKKALWSVVWFVRLHLLTSPSSLTSKPRAGLLDYSPSYKYACMPGREVEKLLRKMDLALAQQQSKIYYNTFTRKWVQRRLLYC